MGSPTASARATLSTSRSIAAARKWTSPSSSASAPATAKRRFLSGPDIASLISARNVPLRSRRHCSLTELGAMLGALFFAEGKPSFRNIAHSFQFALHLGVLGFHPFGIGIRWHVNRRGEEHQGPRKWLRQEKMVPRF